MVLLLRSKATVGRAIVHMCLAALERFAFRSDTEQFLQAALPSPGACSLVATPNSALVRLLAAKQLARQPVLRAATAQPSAQL